MSSRSTQRVVILFDLGYEPPEDHDYSELLKEVAFESERAVFNAVKKMGAEPILLGVHSDIFRLTRELKRLQPDLVFNLTEAFNNKRDESPQLAGLFDLMSLPYTGTKSLGLGLSQDKNLAKKILVHHRIRVPKWITSHVRRPLKAIRNFQFPAFVKPTKEEASEGIARDSFVENERDCLDRVHFLHEKYKSDVIIEEFIEGREFYVSVIGNKRLTVLPIREISFKEFPEDQPKFATYKAKWDQEYRKRWGIKNEFAKGLTEEQTEAIQTVAKRAFEALQLSGFARFDIRLSPTNEVVLLEANPNPSLSPWDDFAQSAQRAGFVYEDLVSKIIDLATTTQ